MSVENCIGASGLCRGHRRGRSYLRADSKGLERQHDTMGPGCSVVYLLLPCDFSTSSLKSSFFFSFFLICSFHQHISFIKPCQVLDTIMGTGYRCGSDMELTGRAMVLPPLVFLFLPFNSPSFRGWRELKPSILTGPV